ncbi:MAG: hypothetical protein PUH24_02490 [Prevotellaceae bacterium]|nr:hypothetical protein [Prevotella sp.]MDD7257143.1 hypothetical protein [Prevotellaceae bacterium]MDY6131705.1 hypothetical protein [Prevotella sp.]
MKKTYLYPQTETVRLHIGEPIAEADFIINSREGNETLGKENASFDEFDNDSDVFNKADLWE